MLASRLLTFLRSPLLHLALVFGVILSIVFIAQVPPFVYTILAVLTVGAAIAILLSYFFVVAPEYRRRLRQEDLALRGKCPSCGYDLRGLAGNCPECGATILRYDTVDLVSDEATLALERRAKLEAIAAASGIPIEGLMLILRAVRTVSSRTESTETHCNAAQLCRAVEEVAQEMFRSPAQARAQLKDWNLATGPAIGAAVFALINAGVLSASPNDSPADFDHLALFTS